MVFHAVAFGIFSFATLMPVRAQVLIGIPDTLSGSEIDLVLKQGTTQFYKGVNTATYGYNGNFLGPTILLTKGQLVTLRVHNELPDTTTTHWHGLHVAPKNDGGPFNTILAGTTWAPSFRVMNEAATCWYHPHLHMKTMEQVLRGAAGMIIVRDSNEAALQLPRSYGVDDIPLVCQFKTIDATTKQFIMSDEQDNVTMVNGTIDGRLNVPAQPVRLRLLNGSSHRYFNLALNDQRVFAQLATDGGLLDAPVSMNSLMLAPGERAEIIVDFSSQNGNIYFLRQLGTQLPAGYPGGPPDGMGMGGTPGPLDNKDFNLLQFTVVAPTATAGAGIPAVLNKNIVTPATGADAVDFLISGSPMMSMTNFVINGAQYEKQRINFNTTQEQVMIWNITNQSMMPHPWHIHGNHFYILSINGATPPANLRGKKDVVDVPPNNGNVKLVMKYADFSDASMPFMYHCHILSHEDNGMMGQFLVNPAVTSIEAMPTSGFQLHAYPNPSSEVWNITGTGNAGHMRAQFVNTLGQTLVSPTIMQNGSDVSIPIANRDLIPGIYFLRVSVGSASRVLQLVKR